MIPDGALLTRVAVARMLLEMYPLCYSGLPRCTLGRVDEPSAVLSAMGVPRDVALGAVRFSLGRPTTEAEIDKAARRVLEALHVAR